MYVYIQVGSRFVRRKREHAGGHPHGTGALRRSWAEEVAIRRVVRRRDAGQPHGGRRTARVHCLFFTLTYW